MGELIQLSDYRPVPLFTERPPEELTFSRLGLYDQFRISPAFGGGYMVFLKVGESTAWIQAVASGQDTGWSTGRPHVFDADLPVILVTKSPDPIM